MFFWRGLSTKNPEIALTFGPYVARPLHFVANDKKGLSLPHRFFLSDHQVFCLELEFGIVLLHIKICRLYLLVNVFE